MSKLTCTNCQESFILSMDCPTEVVSYEGENYCNKDCVAEHNDLSECSLCEELKDCEYENNTCSSYCQNELTESLQYGDMTEHRTY